MTFLDGALKLVSISRQILEIVDELGYNEITSGCIKQMTEVVRTFRATQGKKDQLHDDIRSGLLKRGEMLLMIARAQK